MSKIINRYGPMPDELLHSFIFRVLSRSGYKKECSAVVSESGWTSRPKLPLNCNWLFDNRNQPNLVNYFANSVGERYAGNVFDSSVLLISNFKIMFLYETIKSPYYGLSIEIKYCEYCFKEQVSEYGFTYFKRNWMYNDVCEIHSLPLKLFQATTEVSCYDFALSPLKQFPLKFDETNNYEKAVYSPSQSDFVNDGQEFKFALCAKRAMIRFLLHTLAIFKYDFFNKYDEVKYRIASSFDNLDLNKRGMNAEYDAVLLRYYSKIIAKCPVLLEPFMMHRVDETIHKYFDEDTGPVESRLIKEKGRSCEECQFCFKQAKEFNPNCSLEITGK